VVRRPRPAARNAQAREVTWAFHFNTKARMQIQMRVQRVSRGEYDYEVVELTSDFRGATPQASSTFMKIFLPPGQEGKYPDGATVLVDIKLT
jgi:hypothetical protein